MERQKAVLLDEFRVQKERDDHALQQKFAETMNLQRHSMVSEFQEERGRMVSDNAQLQSHLDQMRAMMAEVQQVTGRRV